MKWHEVNCVDDMPHKTTNVVFQDGGGWICYGHWDYKSKVFRRFSPYDGYKEVPFDDYVVSWRFPKKNESNHNFC